jgi:hypothetical protein
MNRIYKHSGRFSPFGVAVCLVGGLGASLPLAFIYAWGIIQIDEQHLSAFAAIAYGAAIGGVVALAAKWGKIRNVQVAAGLAVLTAAVSYYFSWAFWMKDIFHTFGQKELNAIAVMQRPQVLWRLMKAVNQYGTWGTTAGKPTTGAELWVIWGFEALGILAVAGFTAVAIIRAQPFCEACQGWCSASEKICLLPVNDIRQIKLAVQQRDFSFLQKLGPGNKKHSHLIAQLHSCPNCHGVNTLTLRQTFMQPRKFGAPAIKHATIAEKLLISCQEADAFRLSAHSINQMTKAAHA